MVASSPSWWLTDVGVELSAKLAMAGSGTMVDALLDRAEPLEASRVALSVDAGAGVPLLVMALLALLPDPAPEPPASAGTYTSFRASGDCA